MQKKRTTGKKTPRFFRWVIARKKVMQNYTYDICQAEAFNHMHHIQRLRRMWCVFHWVQFMNSIRSREEEIMRAEFLSLRETAATDKTVWAVSFFENRFIHLLVVK